MNVSFASENERSIWGGGFVRVLVLMYDLYIWRLAILFMVTVVRLQLLQFLGISVLWKGTGKYIRNNNNLATIKNNCAGDYKAIVNIFSCNNVFIMNVQCK